MMVNNLEKFKFTKTGPSSNLSHSVNSESSKETPANSHNMSDSDSCSTPITRNGVNGTHRVYTISDSEEEEIKPSKPPLSSLVVISDSDDDGNAPVPADESSQPKVYSRIKTIFSSPESLVHTAESATPSSSLKRKAPQIKAQMNKKRKKKLSDLSSEDEGGFKGANGVIDSDMDSDEEVSNTMNSSQTRVFDFLNNATDTELLLVPSCTQMKASVVTSLRPYKSWRQAVQAFKDTRSLGLSLLNSISGFLKSRQTVSYLMRKCLNIATHTEAIISEEGTKVDKQPALLNSHFQLKGYQMVGLNWLSIMHEQKLNVILADEMGLGKTIQVIAFLAYLNETGQSSRPHLIVAPSSTIENWSNEFSKWCHYFNVEIYHGSPDERKSIRVQWFKQKFVGIDVIITSYNMISSSLEEKKMFKIMPLHYVVFDEAHLLKNMNTQRYVNLFSINAQRRILLTGTPLQNNLLELMSLLNFVMPDMFHGKIDSIKEFFSKKSKLPVETLPKFEQEQVELAKRIMKPFILRRLKADVLQYLPKKTCELVKCKMTGDQQEKYDLLKSESAELAKIGGPNYNYMSTFMALRKLANHPLTLRYIFQEEQLYKIASLLAKDKDYKEGNENYIFDDLCVLSDHDIHKLAEEFTCIAHYKLADKHFLSGGKFKLLDQILPGLKAGGHRVVLFSQFVFMLDLIEHYMTIRDYSYLRLDGSVRSLDRQDLIDSYNEDSSIFVFLCTTKAGGIGINLTTADTVIIHDVDFNPYNDKQAEDRCHRLGQTRPVKIMRFISENTVEESIYEMAQNKLNLEQELTNTGEDENEEKTNVELLLKEALGLVE